MLISNLDLTVESLCPEYQDAIVRSGLVKSKTELRRLVDAKAVSIREVKKNEDDGYVVIQIGKKRFLKIKDKQIGKKHFIEIRDI